MSAETVGVLRSAVANSSVVDRYRSHIVTDGDYDCHLWVGAVSGRGHGRFYIGSRNHEVNGHARRQTFVVIAHRFGYAIEHGVDALLAVPLIAHWTCDNPLCQNPEHWQASNHYRNGRDYANRRHTLGTPLADRRGARGRAHAIRQAARAGEPIRDAVLAGLPKTHTDQEPLFDTDLQPILDLEMRD